jgi:hypothetical protein
MWVSTHLCSDLQLLQAEGRSKPSPPCTSRRRHVSSTRGEQCLLQQSVISHANGVSDYTQNLQNNDSAPLLCATGPLVSGGTQLSTSTAGKMAYVWGQNSQGDCSTWNGQLTAKQVRACRRRQ